MATIDQLKELTERTPHSLQDWLSLYGPDDREVIVSAILHADTTQAYEALSQLQPYPYPFQRNTIPHHRRALRLGGVNV